MTSPIICCFDTETTGKLTGDHKIIEFYGALWQDGKIIEELELRINPERTISIDAERVHKISLPMLKDKPVFRQVAAQILRFMERADIFAGHNIDEFDVPFMNQEFAPLGLALPPRPTIDSMLLGSFTTPDGKTPNLREFCFAMSIEYDPSAAHAARYDVTVNMEAINRAISEGYIKMPVWQPVALAA